MSESRNLTKKHAIGAAFRKLTLVGEKERELQIAIENVCIFCKAPQKQLPAFRDIGKNKTTQELKNIISLSNKLARQLDSLHGPAVLALANIGLHEIRITLPPLLTKMSRAVQEKVTMKTDWKSSGPVKSTAAADTRTPNKDSKRKNAIPPEDSKSVKGGRPINLQANILAAILSHYYHELTGKEPTLIVNPYSKSLAAYGPFLELVSSVFKAAGIRSSAEHAARLAIDARRK